MWKVTTELWMVLDSCGSIMWSYSFLNQFLLNRCNRYHRLFAMYSENKVRHFRFLTNRLSRTAEHQKLSHSFRRVLSCYPSSEPLYILSSIECYANEDFQLMIILSKWFHLTEDVQLIVTFIPILIPNFSNYFPHVTNTIYFRVKNII